MADSSIRVYYETRELCHQNVYSHLRSLRKSLLELKLSSKKALHENTLFWQLEVEKAKQKKDKEWLEKINSVEDENKQLRRIIQDLSSPNTFTLNNDLQLLETEDKITKLTRQLDQKLIEINKLQIALSEQSKAMFELEKSFVLLFCRSRRTFLNNNNIRPIKDLQPQTNKTLC